ncbi:hypothetical protein N0V88_004496 [Collariella sp. IMI 366227]|nr:hypothetical protein N0V88_004496 [Collariella sp. IMI 366227]
MPDKTLRVVTYAAGASLAAITLIYVFGPTYFLDSDPSSSTSGAFSTRKKGVVGLVNPANDCFINSVLQALAGLGDLRIYLIREMIHRRRLDDESVYAQPVPPWALAEKDADGTLLRLNKDIPGWKLQGMQRGLVTKGLKDILDALNERPIYKKTISAAPFVCALEEAFRQRISRQQQDAQEFLQVVAERLCNEYHAGRSARKFASHVATLENGSLYAKPVPAEDGDAKASPLPNNTNKAGDLFPNGEQGFALEVSSTTLGTCFDGMFKTEYIDDFKCEKCRLVHALGVFQAERDRSTSDAAKAEAQRAMDKLKLALDTDPENPPEDLALPDSRYAPKRRIARHIRMTDFPKILAIHLSRSIFDASRSSQKNSAKVAFPEDLPMGGLLRQRMYKLLGVVTHKGSHHSGHYESFRRQNLYPPFSNPGTFQPAGVFSKTASPASTPRVGAQGKPLGAALGENPMGSGDEGSSNTVDLQHPITALPSRLKDSDAVSFSSAEASPRSSTPKVASSLSLSGTATPTRTDDKPPSTRLTPAAKLQQRKQQARWWRISDDKVKEANTRDVLGMQREVYLLFYELERPHLQG